MPPKRKSSVKAPPSSALDGLTFCITGTLSVPRADMEKYIQDNGGEVAKTVTKKCTHLISAQSGTKKCDDAEKKGVIVVDEAWVREQCGDEQANVTEPIDDEPLPKAKKAKVVKEAKKAQVAASNANESIYMECNSSSGGKFWECNLAGSNTTVTYGKVGAAGATQAKDHGSDDAARKYFDKMLREKTNKGYQEVSKASQPVKDEPSNSKVVEKKAVKPVKTLKAEATAPDANSDDSVHLVCPSSSGGKFWQCSLSGSQTTVTYGKVGTDGATQVKDHGSEEAARKFFDKMVKEKSKKGYN